MTAREDAAAEAAMRAGYVEWCDRAHRHRSYADLARALNAAAARAVRAARKDDSPAAARIAPTED